MLGSLDLFSHLFYSFDVSNFNFQILKENLAIGRVSVIDQIGVFTREAC